MPSFDVVSEVNKHELVNAVDQANREVGARFDFKGVDATFTLKDNSIELKAQVKFQLEQMIQVLHGKMVKRGIDILCLEKGTPVEHAHEARMTATVKEGLDSQLAKKIVKLIKDKKMKVQAQIQGEQVRVTGKKRDDLQEVIAMLKQEDLGMPLQYTNFRD